DPKCRAAEPDEQNTRPEILRAPHADHVPSLPALTAAYMAARSAKTRRACGPFARGQGDRAGCFPPHHCRDFPAEPLPRRGIRCDKRCVITPPVPLVRSSPRLACRAPKALLRAGRVGPAPERTR